MKTFFIVLIIILSPLNTYTQDQNQHLLFPHHVGDLWEYDEWDFWGLPISKFHAIITTDTLDSEGNSHVHFANNYLWHRGQIIQGWPSNEFIIDTLNNVYHQIETGLPDFLIYKLDAQQGDQWVMHSYGTGNFEMARCVRTEMINIFNEWRASKVYSYFLAFDSTDTTGLVRSYSRLTEGLGLTFDGGTHDAGYELHLWGAVIDGVLFGDTTYLDVNISPNLSDIPNTIELFQNYPNPFNSRTKISFTIFEKQEIILVLHDINGKLIKTIYQGICEAGTHTYPLEISDLPSGIYIYSLKSGFESYQKKCILIK
jgi:hypothetical protein